MPEPTRALSTRVCWYGSGAVTNTPPKNPVSLCAHSCAAAQSALHDYLWLRHIHLPSTEIAHGAALRPLVSLTTPGSVTFEMTIDIGSAGQPMQGKIASPIDCRGKSKRSQAANRPHT